MSPDIPTRDAEKKLMEKELPKYTLVVWFILFQMVLNERVLKKFPKIQKEQQYNLGYPKLGKKL